MKEKKRSKKRGELKRVQVPASGADLERAYLELFAAQGIGLDGTAENMGVAAIVAKARALECAEVLNRVSEA